MDDDKTLLDQRNDQEIRPGTLLLGTYRVERQLNSGGMALTFLTRHCELDNSRHVVKVIKSRLVDTLADALNVKAEEAEQKSIALFKREAEVLMKIRHEAIVGYHGFQKDDRYGFCLVMEYVEGPTLKEFLQQGRISLPQFWQLRDQLAAGLAATHDKGIFHRDISPDNIILPDGQIGRAKLIDFGIAKVHGPVDKGTIIGALFVGKYDYAPPEQFSGEPIGAYSDIYSFGMVLAEALTGKKINQRPTGTQRLALPSGQIDLSALPRELRPQFSAMLQAEPKLRLQSIAELLKRWPAPVSTAKQAGTKAATPIPMKPITIGLLSILLLSVAAGYRQFLAPPHSSIPPRDDYGYLTVTSTPPGALVLTDDATFVGITPVKRALLPARHHTLVINKKGYREENKPVRIEKGEELNENVALNSQPDTPAN